MSAVDEDEDGGPSQLVFLEDYAKETQGAPTAPTPCSVAPPRKRRAGARQARASVPGKYWTLASSGLAVAEHALRAVVALRDTEWKPPAWLVPHVASQTATVVHLADKLAELAEAWMVEQEDVYR